MKDVYLSIAHLLIQQVSVTCLVQIRYCLGSWGTLVDKRKKIFFALVKLTSWGSQLSRFNRVQLFVTPWAIACQVPLSMGFSRQEYWSGLPCPPLGDLPNPGIKPGFPMSTALAGEFVTTSATWEILSWVVINKLINKDEK